MHVFSRALMALKAGKSIRRTSWTEGQTVTMIKGSVPHDGFGIKSLNGISPTLFETSDDQTHVRLPVLRLYKEDGSYIDGWVPTQPDMLTGDWEIDE